MAKRRAASEPLLLALLLLGMALVGWGARARFPRPLAALPELCILDPRATVQAAAPHARQLVSPNQNERGLWPPDTVVVHCTAGSTARSALGVFLNPQAGASAHILIPDDGFGEPRQSIRLVEDRRKAWHVLRAVRFRGEADVNARSLGIEIVNRCVEGDPYSAWQVAEAARWTRYWISRHPIRYLVTHAYLDPQHRRDPCVSFPWEQFLLLVFQGMTLPDGSLPIRVILPDGSEVPGVIQKGHAWVPLRPLADGLGYAVIEDPAHARLRLR